MDAAEHDVNNHNEERGEREHRSPCLVLIQSSALLGRPFFFAVSVRVLLASQRLKLYHVMRHFKMHVMLSLKARLKTHSKALYQSAEPRSKADAYKLLNNMFRRGSVDKVVGKQFQIWETLNAMASGYSLQDTRKTQIDLDQLASFQNFESEQTPLRHHARGNLASRRLLTSLLFSAIFLLPVLYDCSHEECMLELFNWRRLDSNGRFDSEAVEQLRALKKSLSTRSKSDANGNGNDNGRASKRRRRNPAAPDDDEESDYELDPEAEAEAEAALRKADAGGGDDESEEEVDPADEPRRHSRRVPAAKSPLPAPAAAAAAVAASAAAPASAARAPAGGMTISGWIRKGNRSGSNASAGAPPSSIESIVEDLTSDTETGHAGAGAGASTAPSLPGSARKRGPPALPLSRVSATSPPRPQEASQHRSPPTSSGKLQLSLGSSGGSGAAAAAAAARSPDGESVHAAFAALSAEEQSNFMQLLGESVKPAHAVTFIRAAPRPVQLQVTETLRELDDLAM